MVLPERESRPEANRAAGVSTAIKNTSMVPPTADTAGEDSRAVYRSSPIKRQRRTKAEIELLDTAIFEVCQIDNPLTVRAVFYRVMSAGVVEKSEKAYAAVQREVLKLRRAGVLPHSWITDGTRWHLKSRSWDSVEQALADAAVSYRRALWNDQREYVEIWSEKEAISSIVSPVTDSYDVPLMIARGFASETFLWSTASTIRDVAKPTTIYQLGDHDPSGIAAWEHVQRRLTAFAPDVEITFERIAVTEEQIFTLKLPTRPTKTTDSRAKNFAGESVEVDAISTSVLKNLVETAIERHIDPVALERTKLFEREERAGLEAMARGGVGMKRIEVQFENASCALVRGHGSRELLVERMGRAPVWATLSRAWVCQPGTARDVIAIAERRGFEVIVSEPGERKDPGGGRW